MRSLALAFMATALLLSTAHAQLSAEWKPPGAWSEVVEQRGLWYRSRPSVAATGYFMIVGIENEFWSGNFSWGSIVKISSARDPFALEIRLVYGHRHAMDPPFGYASANGLTYLGERFEPSWKKMAEDGFATLAPDQQEFFPIFCDTTVAGAASGCNGN